MKQIVLGTTGIVTPKKYFWSTFNPEKHKDDKLPLAGKIKVQ